MRIRSTLLAGALLFAAPAAGAQTPVPVGSEFQVNTYTSDDQLVPVIAPTPNGGFVVVWESRGSDDGDTSLASVQGQRFAPGASPLGSQFQVNSTTAGWQWRSAVAATSAGDFVVAWARSSSPGNDTSCSSIRAPRLAPDDSPLGSELQINSYTMGPQGRPAVAATPAGDFVVVWDSYGSPDDTSYASIQGQRFASDGNPLGDEFQINTFTTGWQLVPAVAVDSKGNFVVAWTSACCDDVYPFSWEIQGQRFASDASPLGDELQITTGYTTAFQWRPAVAMDSTGDFVVVWAAGDSAGGDTSSGSIQGRRFTSDAKPLGSQFQVNTYTTSGQDDPVIAVAPAGDFVVVWHSNGSSGDDASSFSIQGQHFAPDASPLGDEFQVNSYTSDQQQFPAVAMDPAGDFVVVWLSQGSSGDDTSERSVQGQRFRVSIFIDGFESGDTTAWSKTVGR